MGWRDSSEFSRGAAQPGCPIPVQTKDVLNQNSYGTKTKVTDGRRAAKIAVGEGGKVSDPVKHKYRLDGKSQEPQSGFLMEEK